MNSAAQSQDWPDDDGAKEERQLTAGHSVLAFIREDVHDSYSEETSADVSTRSVPIFSRTPAKPSRRRAINTGSEALIVREICKSAGYQTGGMHASSASMTLSSLNA